jgi:plastocyanin
MPVLSRTRASAATPIRLLVATLAAGAADASISLSSAGPQAGATVTATATGANDPTATDSWTFGVTDPFGTNPPNSQNLPPTGNFTWSPSVPRTGQALKLIARGSDPDGTITNMEWDLDGNGSYADVVDQVGRFTTVRFTTPGQHVVNLRITDDGGSTTVVTGKIPVAAPPAAGFTWSPVTPTVGQAVTFTSTSSDPDGTVVATNWDLDGQRKFNDWLGASVQRAFSAPGTYEISVRATDDTGLTDVATQRITVVAPPTPPSPAPVQAQNASPAAKPPRTALNAIVRLSGVITSRGTRITRLTVNGPPGASVTGRCRGRGCPRAPTVVVTRSGRIGKYTRFTIRRNASPARKDMCVNGRTITKCPP